MDSQIFDVVKSEKEKALVRFNRFRRIAKLRQMFEVVVVLALVSWSSARVPAVMKTVAGCVAEVSAYLFNHHVVFVIGNAIIVLLFVLCRHNDAVNFSGDGDFYDDYVKHSEGVHPRDPTVPPPPCPVPDTADFITAGTADGVEEKQIVVCTEIEQTVPQCDDVSEAIAKATKQIRRFQRTQSEKLRSEMAARPAHAKLRRSETQNRRETAVSTDELERLSSEDFQRRIDAFIDTHWCKKHPKDNQFGERRLLKMA